jgi:hypothetical protein
VDFDRTPLNKSMLRKLDVFVQDAAILDIISTIYGRVSQTWAVDYPTDAAFFFTRPYPDIAIDMLGYPGDETIHFMECPNVIAHQQVSDSETIPLDLPAQHDTDAH